MHRVSYDMLWQMWQSGQIPVPQMAEWLRDEVFRRWLKKRDLLGNFLAGLIPKDASQ